ncbi:MAG: serine/threonine protein kinase [Bradymonadaceae bacterium]|nr:serine/threonine protein kinase [Lujinxingiaceae bacterium]
MKLFCPECRTTFEEELATCPHDGSPLFQIESGGTDPLLGATIDDRFRVDWLLGAGGMGSVYGGVQLSVNREVAIKVLRTELADKELALERFFREAKLVSELTHPNIVRLIEFGQDRKRDLLYLVMELVRGRNLGDLLRRGRFRINLALEVIYQVCGALTEPHARGIIHRDLKPDNLLMMPVSDGTVQVKVLDFGIARVLEANTQLTGTGMICGTPAYMAPEQAQNFELDARTDLYALGVMLYEMLSGVPPFVGTSSLQIMLKHIQEFPRPLKEVLPPGALPEGIEELVNKLIAKNPRDRLDSARKVRDAIDEIRVTHSLKPVRFDGDFASDAYYEPFLLPRLPGGSMIKSSPTEALRRETGLELSMGLGSNTSDLAIADTEMSVATPAASSLQSVQVAKVAVVETRGGGVQGWTPGPQGALKLAKKPDSGGPVRATMVEAPPEPEPAKPAMAQQPPTAAKGAHKTAEQSQVSLRPAPRKRSLAAIAVGASIFTIAAFAGGMWWMREIAPGHKTPGDLVLVPALEELVEDVVVEPAPVDPGEAIARAAVHGNMAVVQAMAAAVQATPAKAPPGEPLKTVKTTPRETPPREKTSTSSEQTAAKKDEPKADDAATKKEPKTTLSDTTKKSDTPGFNELFGGPRGQRGE